MRHGVFAAWRPGSQERKPAAAKTTVAKKAKGPVRVEVKRNAASSKTRAVLCTLSSPSAAAVQKSERAEKVVRGGRNVVATIHQKNGKTVVAVQRRSVVRVVEAPARQSFGQMAGLHGTEDVLDLKSSVALVIDQDTHEVLFSKNDHAVLPIASLTKLMTGLLISEAQLPIRRAASPSPRTTSTPKSAAARA